MTRRRVSPRACPHCGSPARMNPCWWFDDHPEQRACGADPPCYGDEYVASMKARERRFGRLWLGVVLLAVIMLLALLARASAQTNHDLHHPVYQNWVNKADKGCCNNQDCGELAEENEHISATGTYVFIEGEWCPVKPEHYLKRGNAPDWSTAHVCVRKAYSSTAAPVCERLLCYQPKPGI